MQPFSLYILGYMYMRYVGPGNISFVLKKKKKKKKKKEKRKSLSHIQFAFKLYHAEKWI